MRVFRWSPKLHPEIESCRALVWIYLPNLPLFLFEKQFLFPIGHLVSSPLSLDIATANLSCPSMARMCIEVDLLKKLSKRIWFECGDEIPGYWQEIEYEQLPSYYKDCKHLSHVLTICKFAHHHLAKPSYTKGKQKPIEKTYYQRKKLASCR